MSLAFTRAAQVLTLAGSPLPRSGQAGRELGIIEQGSVVIDEGRIVWVGPHAEFVALHERGELPEVGRADAIHDCAGKVVMPAFVDPHTHLVWAGDRRDELELRLAGTDYEHIFAAGGGILSSVRQTRAASDQELFEQSLRRIERMQACGTTSFEIKSGYGLDLETELRQLRVARRLRDEVGVRIKTTCLAAHALPAEARGSDEARARFVDAVVETILPAVVAEGLADYADVFCERGAFTKQESGRVLAKAAALGLGLRVHAHEFDHSGGVELAAELRAKSADHLLVLDDRERKLLHDAGVVAVLLPGTSLVLGKPFADGRALIEAGVAVAIATDCNPGSCAFENLAMVVGLACYGCKLSPAEAIVAATHNAAASLDLADEVGRLEPGMSADLLVLATSDYRDLVYHAGSPLVREVYSRGRRLH
ncbi:imidazolonepropionase [Nannocystaceae bacterium ST9]